MTLRATLYDAKGRDRPVELAADVVQSLASDTLLWVDLDEIDEAELGRVGKILELPGPALKSIVERETRALLERFPKLIRLRVVAAQPAAPDADRDDRAAKRHLRLETAIIDILAAPNLVVTVHDGSVVAFEEFERGIHGETRFGKLDAASFMAALIDSVLAVYLAVVEDVQRRVDALDEQALRSGDAEIFLAEVVALRRRVAGLRRALAPLRVALAPLARPDMDIPELGEPWPGLLDRLERLIDIVENTRETLIGSFDVFMARNAERTNDIMKTLTILNAVLLPSAVVAGVMGMNFRLGFFDAAANFWFVIAAMVSLAVAILGFSRWRGWI